MALNLGSPVPAVEHRSSHGSLGSTPPIQAPVIPMPGSGLELLVPHASMWPSWCSARLNSLPAAMAMKPAPPGAFLTTLSEPHTWTLAALSSAIVWPRLVATFVKLPGTMTGELVAGMPPIDMKPAAGQRHATIGPRASIQPSRSMQ